MGRKRCLVFVLALCLATLAGCQGSGIQNQVTTVTYDRPESYTAGGGETTQPVERVTIDWYSGSVTVARHNGDAVAFSETANRTLEEELTLRWRVEDGTLSLVYCQAGQVQLGDLEKDLTVLLPRDLTLEELEVDTGAAPVQVSDIAAGAMTLGTGSGAIDLQACQVTEGAWLDTGSGNITADLTGPCWRTQALGRCHSRQGGCPSVRWTPVPVPSPLPRRPSRPWRPARGPAGSPSRPASWGPLPRRWAPAT